MAIVPPTETTASSSTIVDYADPVTRNEYLREGGRFTESDLVTIHALQIADNENKGISSLNQEGLFKTRIYQYNDSTVDQAAFSDAVSPNMSWMGTRVAVETKQAMYDPISRFSNGEGGGNTASSKLVVSSEHNPGLLVGYDNVILTREFDAENTLVTVLSKGNEYITSSALDDFGEENLYLSQVLINKETGEKKIIVGGVRLSEQITNAVNVEYFESMKKSFMTNRVDAKLLTARLDDPPASNS